MKGTILVQRILLLLPSVHLFVVTTLKSGMTGFHTPQVLGRLVYTKRDFNHAWRIYAVA